MPLPGSSRRRLPVALMALGAVVLAGSARAQCALPGSGLIEPTTDEDPSAFGAAVGLGAGTLVAGSRSEANGWSGFGGVAYVFGGVTTASWNQLQRIVPGEADSDGFGQAVAVDGLRIAVGAPFGSTGSHGMTGKVFLYERGNSLPVTWYPMTAAGLYGLNGRWLGYAVDLEGEVLIAGAPAVWSTHDNQGAVYVFGENEGGTGAWGLVKRIDTPNPEVNGQLGTEVALAGQTLYAAAPGERRVYAFAKNLGGLDAWGLAGTFEPPPGLGADDWFATSVAAVETGPTVAKTRWVLIGSPRNAHSGGHGKAFLYARGPFAATWSLVATLQATGGGGVFFGNDVAMGDGWAAVGSGSGSGATVTLFRPGPGGVWQQVTRSWVGDPTVKAISRVALAAHGERLAVGFPEADAAAVATMPLFCDGFESGGTGRWAITAP